MEPAVDPFHPLLRILDRYRADVHHLRPGAPPRTVDDPQGPPIPQSLRTFLLRWNGAVLFRGVLRVRAVVDIAQASHDASNVWLFADGPKDELWGYAAVSGGWHFGRWDGKRLTAMHEHFGRWLHAQARILDEDRREGLPQIDMRLETDPECGLLHFQRGEHLLAEGDAAGALGAFRRATALSPDHAAAWQRTGEALLATDHAAARHAFIMALRSTTLPLPYPGAPAMDASTLRVMESLFPADDVGWERELHHLIHERSQGLSDPDAARLFEAAALGLSRIHIARKARPEARQALVFARDRALSMPGGAAPLNRLSGLLLAIVGLDTDLGDHEEAEDTLRRLKAHTDPEVRARADLALARIALLRQEPFVDEILHEALEGLTRDEDRCDAWLLMAERGSSASHLGASGLPPDRGALGEAIRLATEMGDAARLSRAELLLGDLAATRGDTPAACQHYLACDADPESHLRAQVRLGDLQDDPSDAIAHYVSAIAGYRALHLPIREAWARLRLVRCGDASQAEDALITFKHAGIASGVAAADLLMQRPGFSLPWHLNAAAEHARGRHDAQRMRAPLTRADADRPERRLLAHRQAIAASDAASASALIEEMHTELQGILRSEGRARDPSVMRFVAGVDLLAGHPSFDAAKALLEFLHAPLGQEAARRALVGAMARSPNMTLVQSLLDIVEARGEPVALCHAIEILGLRSESAALPSLRVLAEEGSTPVRRAAITALGRIGDPEAIDIILPALDVPALAEIASVALLLLGEWQGVDFHGQAMHAGTPTLAYAPGEMVGRFGGPSYYLLLLNASEKEGATGAGAIHGLGLLGCTRAVPRLIEYLTARDPQRSNLAVTALELLTGHIESLEDGHPRQRWEAWWEANKHNFDDHRRFRYGRTFGVRDMLDRLGHDDAGVRTVGYDELVISTGVRLPFDVDGPWRVQVHHRDAWNRWYADHAHELPRTGWMFHGESIG